MKNVTAIIQQKQISDKLEALNNYVDRLENVISGLDLSKKPDENLSLLENHIHMIQGQTTFVRDAIEDMKKEFGNG